MIVRKLNEVWVVQRKHSKQIVFSHKNVMQAYEYLFKQVNYA